MDLNIAFIFTSAKIPINGYAHLVRLWIAEWAERFIIPNNVSKLSRVFFVVFTGTNRFVSSQPSVDSIAVYSQRTRDKLTLRFTDKSWGFTRNKR